MRVGGLRGLGAGVILALIAILTDMGTDGVSDPGAETARADGDAFVIEPRSIGLVPGLSYDSICDVIAFGEGEESR